MPYQPGDTLINKYRIESLIGRGAFAEVYRVTHLGLDVTRALKVFSRSTPGVGSTEFNDFLERFQLEAHLGAKLNTPNPQPNLLQVHNFQQDGDRLILEMEYAPGGNLAERIAAAKAGNEKIPLAEVIQIGVDIARGLMVIHQHDIVHRDLKPGNIMLDRDGRAKVADLGLAQVPGGPSLRSQLSEPLPHPGTPGFMSPEQEQSGHLLRPASDIYACGVLIFELLTGRNYHFVKTGTRASEIHPDTPRWLDELVMHMLSKDHNARPWDGGVVLRFFEAGAAKKPSVTTNLKSIPTGVWRFFGGIALFIFVTILGLAAANLYRNLSAPEETAPAPILTTVTQSSVPQVKLTTITPTISPTPTPSESLTLTPTDTATIFPTPSLTPSFTLTSGPDIGTTKTSPFDGMVMVYVPAGEFVMGSDYGEQDEQPEHTVYLDAYWIDQTEVTYAQFQDFLQDESYATEPCGDGIRPVACVDWGDAQAYCQWVGRRLPTEAEWEKAAIWDPITQTSLDKPWGRSTDCRLANYYGCIGSTSPVGNYPAGASKYGVLDMAGNVWEWVADKYGSDYYANSPVANPSGPTSGDYRVLRGYSWDDPLHTVSMADRFKQLPIFSGSDLGFRCALDAEP